MFGHLSSDPGALELAYGGIKAYATMLMGVLEEFAQLPEGGER